MAIVTRALVCAACGSEWSGSWRLDSSVQPDSAKCPKCGNSALVRPKSYQDGPKSDVSSGNHFNVRIIDGNVCFSIFQAVEGKNYELRGELEPALALNLSAWLALLADPAGHEFCRVYNEIKKT